MRRNITPVILVVRYSIFSVMLKIFDNLVLKNAMINENSTTGIPLANPKRADKIREASVFIANGISVPKNKTADVGQKLNAKIIPNNNALKAPQPSIYFRNLSLKFIPEKFGTASKPIKNIAVIISNGPKNIFMYFCRACETIGATSIVSANKNPKMQKVISRPSV